MTDHAIRWLTIREAALALGVSDLTIRRRIKDGRIAHRLENGKYLVALDDNSSLITRQVGAESAGQDVPEAAGKEPEPLPFDLDHLLGEYARLAEAAGRAAVLEARVRELEQRQGALQEGMVALANRNGWLESKLEEREHAIKLLTDTQRRGFWQRVFGRA